MPGAASLPNARLTLMEGLPAQGRVPNARNDLSLPPCRQGFGHAQPAGATPFPPFVREGRG